MHKSNPAAGFKFPKDLEKGSAASCEFFRSAPQRTGWLSLSPRASGLRSVLPRFNSSGSPELGFGRAVIASSRERDF
jgi:hypothetical protein